MPFFVWMLIVLLLLQGQMFIVGTIY